jgi:hypothetical protein
VARSRDRDTQAEFARRTERAQSAGYGSFYEQRKAEKYVADNFDLAGPENRRDRQEMAAFMHNYADGDLTRDQLRRMFAQWSDGDNDDLFYRWLADLYGVI